MAESEKHGVPNLPVFSNGGLLQFVEDFTKKPEVRTDKSYKCATSWLV